MNPVERTSAIAEPSSPRTGEEPIGVPRRFGLGPLMVVVTAYSVLFATMTSLGAHPVTFGIVAIFFTGVAIGQVVFFRGKLPREASYLSGVLLCPAILLGLFVGDRLVDIPGVTLGLLGIGTVPRLVSVMIVLAMLGALPGYVAGCMAAGIFLVMDRFRRARGGAALETSPPVGPATEDGVKQQPGLDERMWFATRRAIRGLSPRQKGRPLRSAVNVLVITILLIGLAGPFLPWVWWHVALGAAAIGSLSMVVRIACLCRWPLALALLVLGALGSMAPAVLGCGVFLHLAQQIGDSLFIAATIVAGCVLGLAAAAVCGWGRWLLEGRDPSKQRTRTTKTLSAATVLVMILVYAGGSLWLYQLWRHPEQRALRALIKIGGQAANPSRKPFARPVTIVYLDDFRLRDADLQILSSFDSLTELRIWSDGIRGPGLAYLDGLTELRTLDLACTSLTDDGLEHLRGCEQLTSLYLGANDISDTGLAHLGELRGLTGLSLWHTQITDAGLVHLADLENLQTLVLSGCRITDAGLEHLSGMPSLIRLDLSSTDVGGNGLENLAKLTGLQGVNLRGTEVEDADLASLGGLSGLTALDLRGTRVTDAGLVHLRGQAALEWLSLDDTQISDAGLVHLRNLSSLCNLDLRDTQVTPKGVNDLRKALPLRCIINASSSDY